MSKNIKGKNIDVNLNITSAGTFNADVFNAYDDFTLNGSSIVARIASNEANIIVLETTKQDNLTIQQTITPSSTAIASSDAIISYVAGSTPSISATFPLNYEEGVISGTFNTEPNEGSNAFLSSGVIYNALLTKQNSLVIQEEVSPSATQICSANAIIEYVNYSNVVSATAPLNYIDRVISGTFDSVPTSGSINFVSSGSLFNRFALYQPLITQYTVLTCADIFSGSLTLTAGINSVLGLSTTNGTIETTNGIIQGQTIRQAGVNLLDEINTKQDILTIQQTITPSSTAIATSDAIIAYVGGQTPSITATYPLNYTEGVISGTFNTEPNAGSNAFLSSGVIYDALATKQNSLVIQASVSPSATQICSADAIIEYVSTNLASKQDTINATTNIDCGSIACFNNIEIDAGNLIVYDGTINGNLFPSLSAGTGIQILQNTPSAGLTQIVNTGSISSSTQYAFQAYGTQGNQSVFAGVRLNFHAAEFCVPDASAYNGSQSIYVVPAGAGGLWHIGFKAFINQSVSTCYLGIYKNGGLVLRGGYSSEATEGFDWIGNANAGDYFSIQCDLGGSTIYMVQSYSSFYGYRIEPVNNTVSTTTALTTGGLTTNGDINIQQFNLRNTNSSLLLNGTTARIDCDSIVIQNQIASSGSIVATTQITSTNGNIVASIGDIIGVNLTGNLSGNLSAGSGIVLTTTTGITEISSNAITTATNPLVNTGGTISATFDSVPTSGSINFVSSGSLFNRFSLFQPLITEFTVITCADLFSGSLTLTAGINSVLGLTTLNGTIESTNGIVQAQTIRQAGVNLLDEINTKQDTITTSTDLGINNLSTTGTIVSAGDIECSADITSVNGSVVSANGSIIANVGEVRGVSVIASGVNLLDEINTKQEILSAGSGIVLTPNTPSAGITEVSVIPETPLSRIYCRGKITQDIPASGLNLKNLYTDFDTLTQGASFATYITPDITNASSTQGIKILTAGTYKVSWNFICFNASYPNRVCWFSRIRVNGIDITPYKTFIYTRGDNTQYAQYGSGYISFVYSFSVNDYILLKTIVAKNSAFFNNDLDGLRGDSGSVFMLEKLD